MTPIQGGGTQKKFLSYHLKNEQSDDSARNSLASQKPEDMSIEERAIYELSSPTLLTNLMVQRPCCFILTGFAILLFISAFSAAMGWLIPQDPHEREFFVWGDPYVNNYDKTRLAQDELISNVDRHTAPL